MMMVTMLNGAIVSQRFGVTHWGDGGDDGDGGDGDGDGDDGDGDDGDGDDGDGDNVESSDSFLWVWRDTLG